MKPVIALIAAGIVLLVLASRPAHALNPSLDISQYAHTAWTVRDGFSPGVVFAMAQTPDGYLWLGSEFGLFHFDGVRFVQWQPPPGEQLPHKAVYSLLAARDGTLWIGTFDGPASWKDGALTRFPDLDGLFVTSMLEDRNGTVWVAAIDRQGGRLCAVEAGRTTCAEDGRFGAFVWSMLEDEIGTLWVGADSGVWRWKPGAPARYAPPPGLRVGDLSRSDDGQLVVGIRDRGLRRLVGETLEPLPIRSARRAAVLLDEREIDSNKLLRDRDGGLWIGSGQRGLLRVHRGRADSFTKSDGLSGDIICSLFEDREGNIWVSTTGGLDRFRELPVTAYSTRQGLTTDRIESLVAAADGSMWLATNEGLVRWKNGQATVFGTRNGLPHDAAQSLFQDARGRIWVFTKGGLAHSSGDRFAAVPGVPSDEVFSITGDDAGHLWLSGNRGLTHLHAGRVAGHYPWSALGRTQQAKVVLSDRGGIWLSFWTDGGVAYFKDGRIRVSYTAADGLGQGHVPGLELDRDGALWVATEQGGLSRIENGRIRTLTTRNGLPCDTIHLTMQDDTRALWVYAACGLFRIGRSDLDAWIADPTRRIELTLWDATDGVRLRAVAPTYGPPMARSPDGKLWIQAPEGVQVVDPRHLPSNTAPPPVHVDRLIVDRQVRWRHVPGGVAASSLRLPPRVRDLEIEYTALSLVSPERVRFKYRLEGQDHEWREVVNERHVQYSNLRPGTYRFRVVACNNSGIWNERGATMEFSVAPAYYQTRWFLGCCTVAALGLLWAGHHVRVRKLRHDFELSLDARVSERTRIARELHDTLLQSFHGLLLRFQTVSHLLPDDPTAAKTRLDDAIGYAARALEEGRDAVHGLRDSTTEGNDLATAVSALGQELAGAQEARGAPALEVTVEGTPRALHPILRDEVYKIAAEALRNAFRHAEATHVAVALRYTSAEFRLRVQDDGKGLEAASLSREGPRGHYGLSGMRERAAIMGGTLTVWSKERAGTAVELCIPGGTAYQRPRGTSWWSRAFARTPHV